MTSSRLLFVAALVTLFCACDLSERSEPYPPDNVSPAILGTGDAWTYEITVTQSLLDTSAVDTLGAVTARMEVTDMNAEVGGRSGLVVLDVYRPSVPDSVERTWYDQSPDALVDMAYNQPGSVDWAQPLLRTGHRNGVQAERLTRGITGLPVLVRRRLASAGVRGQTTTDSIQVREDPRVVLKAPLRKGEAWVSFREPFLSRRSVVGRSLIETRVGRFEAVEVRNTLPEVNASLRWVDYYAETGLVRRVVTDTVEVRGPEGERRGGAVLREVYELVSSETGTF